MTSLLDQLGEAKCGVCRKCTINPQTGRCPYGGPYRGYLMPDGSIQTVRAR